MTAPVLASTRSELAALLSDARRAGQRIGLVPTMGALHEGHASLMRMAREQVGADGKVVVSIFVNPLQFGAGEDLDRYPRTLEADLAITAQEDVDIVFAPSVEEVYPGWAQGSGQPQVTLDPGPLGAILEGSTRPGHFAGMLIVVAKLFGLVGPDVAVFGEKDYQQLALIRRMVEDLCLGIDVVGAPTRRERDGLALSSRNRYLGPEERLEAVHLSRALFAAQDAAAYGAGAALDAAHAEVRRATSVDIDYLVVTAVDLGELPEAPPAGTEARILVAARVGSTRLIDNMSLTIGSTTGSGSDS
ncbi:pantoate--beta-alanine ligase [Nocardioides sp. Iso805N]|uniref:pantoate--beta-alanine ligase n=1 Tax=Nocardioides sp. Iso805N TaxID=1283287 RepID=UPI000360B57E|nr:pantoate--beta-alanine ligase [Nocardioides sp. Iso805N]